MIMLETQNTTEWIDVNEIQEKYLPISKKAIRKKAPYQNECDREYLLNIKYTSLKYNGYLREKRQIILSRKQTALHKRKSLLPYCMFLIMISFNLNI